MPGVRIPTPERANGDKSRYYTDIRQKIAKMERDEWRQWFRECIAELQKNEELWHYIVRERKLSGKFKDGKYLKTQERVGRPPAWKSKYEDTRNRYNEI